MTAATKDTTSPFPELRSSKAWVNKTFCQPAADQLCINYYLFLTGIGKRPEMQTITTYFQQFRTYQLRRNYSFSSLVLVASLGGLRRTPLRPTSIVREAWIWPSPLTSWQQHQEVPRGLLSKHSSRNTLVVTTLCWKCISLTTLRDIEFLDANF